MASIISLWYLEFREQTTKKPVVCLLIYYVAVIYLSTFNIYHLYIKSLIAKDLSQGFDVLQSSVQVELSLLLCLTLKVEVHVTVRVMN